jgi:hypothetical protein
MQATTGYGAATNSGTGVQKWRRRWTMIKNGGEGEDINLIQFHAQKLIYYILIFISFLIYHKLTLI